MTELIIMSLSKINLHQFGIETKTWSDLRNQTKTEIGTEIQVNIEMKPEAEKKKHQRKMLIGVQ